MKGGASQTSFGVVEPVKIDVGSQLKLSLPSFQLPNMGSSNKRPREAKIVNKAILLNGRALQPQGSSKNDTSSSKSKKVSIAASSKDQQQQHAYLQQQAAAASMV